MKNIIINYLKDFKGQNEHQVGIYLDHLAEELNLPTSELLDILIELEKDNQLTIHQGISGPMIYLK